MNDREKLVGYWTRENILQKEKGYFDYATRRMFDQYLTDLKETKVLDVGCGLGMSMDYFIGQGAQVLGVDITPQTVKAANLKGLRAIEADARSLPYKNNSFDIVYSIGVIEHFQQTQMALEEQVRVCKPGGIVIAVVPNLLTPYSIGMVVFELLSFRAHHGLLITYGKSFSRSHFKNMFRKAGCKNVIIQPYYGSAFLRLLFNKIYKNLTNAIEKSIFSRTLGLVLWGMGYKAQS